MRTRTARWVAAVLVAVCGGPAVSAAPEGADAQAEIATALDRIVAEHRKQPDEARTVEIARAQLRPLMDAQGRERFAHALNAVFTPRERRAAERHDRATLEAFAAACRGLGTGSAELAVRTDLARSYRHHADWSKALDAYRRVLELAMQAEDANRISATFTATGEVLERLGRLDDALAAHRAALEFDRQLGMRRSLATDHAAIARVLGALKRGDEEIEALRLALAAAPESFDADAEADALRRLTDAFLAAGRGAEALDAAERGLKIAQAGSSPAAVALARFQLGRARFAVKQYDAALAVYREALDYYQGRPDGYANRAALLGNMGLCLELSKRFDEAIASYRQAIALYQKLKQPEEERRHWLNLGDSLNGKGQFRQAEDAYRAALRIDRRRGEAETIAQDLRALGITALDRGDPPTALEHLREALELYRQAGVETMQADVLDRIGRAQSAMRQDAAALESFEAALALRVRNGDVEEQSYTLRLIAAAHVQQLRFDAAGAVLERALMLVPEPRAPAERALVLRTLATLDYERGDIARARENYSQTARLAAAAGDARTQIEALWALAGMELDAGGFAAAQTAYRRVLEHARAERMRDLEGGLLLALALVATELRQFAEAESLIAEAVPIAQQTGDLSLQRDIHSARGAVAGKQRQHARARREYAAAAEMDRAARNVFGEAAMLNNLAMDWLREERPRQALKAIDRALAIYRGIVAVGDEAQALDTRGQVLQRLGRTAEALEAYRESAILLEQTERRAVLWESQWNIARALRDLGRGPEAAFFGKLAVNGIQALRSRASGLSREQQRGLLHDKVDAYQGVADILIGQGRLAEAEQVLAMLKEEEYFDFIRRDAAADPRQTQASLTRAESEWAARYRDGSARLAAAARELAQLARVPPEQRSAEQRERYLALKAEKEAANRTFQEQLGQLEQAFKAQGVERAMDFAAQDLKSLRAVQASLARLGQGAVLLHFLVLPDKLHILVTTPDAQLHRESAIGQAQLDRLILQYREILQAPYRDPLPAAQALYRALIEPVAEDLAQAQAQTLMLALDGTLRYLPFAAMHDGAQYLAQRYGIAIFTAAARSSLERAPAEEWTVAGLGVSEAAAGFSPLPAVPAELDEIVRATDADASGVLPGTVRLDAQFTAEALTETLEAGHPVVHLASHFHFVPGTEADSFLLLGGGGRLSLADFKTGNFPLHGVDLLTLSACQTAMGDAQNGREVEGFGALAQNQGAASVMATLWSVADGTTGVFMREFYRRRQDGHLSKAQALRQAQTAFIGGEIGVDAVPDTVRGMRRTDAEAGGGTAYRPPAAAPYSHPFYWAPFILMGNWR